MFLVDSEGLFYVWIVSLIIGTCYTLYWDICKDWGLLSKDAGENRFLREQIVYENKVRNIWIYLLKIWKYNFHYEQFIFNPALKIIT